MTAERLAARFGPHPRHEPAGGWTEVSRRPIDKLVKTHCCFCGQQCGLQLEVQGNVVVGVEPWEEFPFNRGMLCPKGVRRALQNGHPDRLLDPLVRTETGFQPTSWDEALDRVAGRLRDIQERHGRDAVAVFGGASLTTEKAYLVGKLARVALRTRNVDYNGRLCMVAAAWAYGLAFGVDRSPFPWEDISKADVVFAAGANIAECAPITTEYVWRSRDHGGRLIVADPRMTPICRNADLVLPVRPGTDTALLMSMLHVVLRDELEDRDFIAEHTVGFEDVAESVRSFDPVTAARITGVPPESIAKAARWIAEADRAVVLHARGIEHHSNGVDNVLAITNLVLATGQIGREGTGSAMITGQGNGQGGREHGQKCDQLPGQRSILDPEARRQVAAVWGVDEGSIPGPGQTVMEIIEAAHRGEIRGLLCLCFNPAVSLPDSSFVREALERLELLCVVDPFLSETAAHADVILPGSLQEEDEGVVTSAEGRVIHVRQAVLPPPNARLDWQILCDLARRLGSGEKFAYESSRQIFDELRRATAGAKADYSGITYEKIDRQMGVFWPCPTEDHRGTPRLFEGGRFWHPDGRARFVRTEHRPSGDPVNDDYPLYLTTGRVVSQYLSGTQTRRIGPLVDQHPEPLIEMHPRLAERHGIRDGDWVTLESRRGDVTLRALVVRTIRHDTVFVPYHWPAEKSINRTTHRTVDPRCKIPEYKVSACRIRKAQRPPAWAGGPSARGGDRE